VRSQSAPTLKRNLNEHPIFTWRQISKLKLTIAILKKYIFLLNLSLFIYLDITVSFFLTVGKIYNFHLVLFMAMKRTIRKEKESIIREKF
jgi:hypothetical protein